MRSPQWSHGLVLSWLLHAKRSPRSIRVVLAAGFTVSLIAAVFVAVTTQRTTQSTTTVDNLTVDNLTVDNLTVDNLTVDNLIAQPAAENVGEDLGDGTRLGTYENDNGVKVFHLRAAPMRLETAPGVFKEAYAFNGIVPGPVIRVNEGDRVRIIVQNDLPEDTTVHWHGMVLPNDQDGVAPITQPHIEPGHSYTYEWTAVSTGTHWYHSHMDGSQVGRGLFGSLEVIPRLLGDIPADRDYRVMVGDGTLGFTINGRVFPKTTPLRARVGERVHIRITGTGPEMIHPMHLHGGTFDVVAQDGNPVLFPQRMDTVNVGVGQTFDIVFTPKNPGHWLFHCHIFSHSETKQGMQGIVTTIEVDPPALPLPLPLLPPLN